MVLGELDFSCLSPERLQLHLGSLLFCDGQFHSVLGSRARWQTPVGLRFDPVAPRLAEVVKENVLSREAGGVTSHTEYRTGVSHL